MKEVYIFDFDNTLIDTTAKVRVQYEPGKHYVLYGSQEFNKLVESPDWITGTHSIDFSQFESADILREEKPLPAMKEMLDLSANHGGDIYLITARQRGGMLHNYLNLCKGIRFPLNNVKTFKAHAHGSVARFKARTLCEIIRINHPAVVHIWEDDDQNVNAMLQVCKLCKVTAIVHPV